MGFYICCKQKPTYRSTKRHCQSPKYDLISHKGEIETGKATTTALEESLTTTHKDVHDFEIKIKELQQKVQENQKLIKEPS